MPGIEPRRGSCRQMFEIPFSAVWYLHTLWQCKVSLTINRQSSDINGGGAWAAGLASCTGVGVGLSSIADMGAP